MIFDVDSAAELCAAIAAAQGGDTISLAAGDYGDVTIQAKTADSDILLCSADPGQQATFHFLQIKGSSHLVFDEIGFHRPLSSGDAEYTPALRVDGSSFITVRDCDFAGSTDGNHTNDGMGFQALSCSYVTLDGNSFHDLKTGSSIGKSGFVVVTGNDYHDIRCDGLELGIVSNATVTGNTFSDFHASAALGDHPDMIQIYNVGATKEMENIVISGNHLMLGDDASGMSPQGIFIQGKPTATSAYGARHITIEDNLIENGSARGISVSGAADVIIDHNTVIRAATAAIGYTPQIMLSDVQGASVTDNVAPAFSEGTSSEVSYDGNTIAGGNNGQAWANLYGTSGGDTILGCGGNEKIWTGAGADEVILPASFVRAIFYDFDFTGADHDTLDLSALGISAEAGTAAYILAHTTYAGGTSTISLPGGRLVQISGLDIRTLGAADLDQCFVFA